MGGLRTWACCLPTPTDAAGTFDLGPFVAGIQNTRFTTHGGAFNTTHLFGPSVVNELRLGYAKTNLETSRRVHPARFIPVSLAR